MFSIEHRPVIKYGGKEFETVESAKVDAMMTYLGMTMQTANEIVLDSDRAAAILLWSPDADAAPGPKGPTVTDEQIAAACRETGVPYKVAKVRVRRQGWTLGKATTCLLYTSPSPRD